jgi:lactoylglutathione lyase
MFHGWKSSPKVTIFKKRGSTASKQSCQRVLPIKKMVIFVPSKNKKMRPFRVIGIQQIAIGNESKTRLENFWVNIMGLEKTGTFRSERENVDEDILRIGTGPFAVEVDIMQPVDAEKSPRVHDPRLNHIGLWIDDLPKAVEWLTAQGVRFTPGGIRKGASGYDVCFIHPKGNDEFPLCSEGVLVELVQAPEEVKNRAS